MDLGGSPIRSVTTPRELVVEEDKEEEIEVLEGERFRVTIDGKRYDVTDFMELHPGGHLLVADGEDMTTRFTQAHGDDLELLDREEIRELDEYGNAMAVKESTHRLATYGGKGGSWREIVGRHSWFFFHSIAAKYPDHPSQEDKDSMRNFVAALGQHYPCKLCRKHLQQQLQDPALGPVRVENRVALSTWFCELHNMVSADIGKKQFDCSPFNIDMMYLKDCGSCEVKETPSFVVDPKTESGYHAYQGPWDAPLYSNDPLLLQSCSNVGDTWDASDLLTMINKAEVFQVCLTFSYIFMQLPPFPLVTIHQYQHKTLLLSLLTISWTIIASVQTRGCKGSTRDSRRAITASGMAPKA